VGAVEALVDNGICPIHIRRLLALARCVPHAGGYCCRYWVPQMTPLSEVAADVAQVFGLTAVYGPTGVQVGWGAPDGDGMYLTPDMLTRSEWRCRCQDWLHDHGWWTYLDTHDRDHQAGAAGCALVRVACAVPEAPARLVSAVWQQREGKP